jgi:hypothetical protein
VETYFRPIEVKKSLAEPVDFFEFNGKASAIAPRFQA